MAGIKELGEAMDGVFLLSLFIAVRMKDGIGWDDAKAIADKFKNDPEFTAALKAAYDGWKDIPAEAKDISLFEGIELGKKVMDFVPKFLDAVKK